MGGEAKEGEVREGCSAGRKELRRSHGLGCGRPVGMEGRALPEGWSSMVSVCGRSACFPSCAGAGVDSGSGLAWVWVWAWAWARALAWARARGLGRKLRLGREACRARAKSLSLACMSRTTSVIEGWARLGSPPLRQLPVAAAET